MSNANLHRAKKRKNDEFYTRYEDVEKELAHYPDAFRGKVVYCNCDDYRWSAFPKYFKENFHKLGVKRLIATCFNGEAGEGETPDLFAEPTGRTAWHYEFDGETETVEKLNGNGAFQSRECVKLLKECDIVCTNPPFSLFRRFFKLLTDNGKEFLLVANPDACWTEEVFSFVQTGKVFADGWSTCTFNPPVQTCWLATFRSDRKREPLELTAKFSREAYPNLDNYNVPHVDRVADIPCDYDGVMAVPVSFLKFHCPEQFELVGATRQFSRPRELQFDATIGKRDGGAYLHGNRLYTRIFIKRKNF